MSLTESPTEFADASLDEADVVRYRAVSPAAVVSLLLGLASAAALWHLLLLFVPLLAVAVSAGALRQLHFKRDELSGRRLALAGLALGVLFLTWSPTRLAFRQWLLYSHARQFADAWLALVAEGRVHEAHQLSLPQRDRQAAETDLPKFYATNNDAQGSFDALFAATPMKQVREAGSAAETRYISCPGIELEEASDRGVWVVILEYEVTWTNQGHGESQPVRLLLRRRVDADSAEAQWQIASVADPSKPPL